LLAAFLQTLKGKWRSGKGLKFTDGFPATPRGRAGKARFSSFIATLNAVPGLEACLAAVRDLPPVRYTEDDWQIVRSCFTLLRQAAGELQIAFAEAGRVDFIEVAQIAQRVLSGEDGLPTDAALALSDGIRHLLVDEFQDTSRRQHQLLGSLIAAWPERAGRTCFVVGDPMQSIYFFRDADAELFPRVKAMGLEVPGSGISETGSLHFDFVPLTANFRTAPRLVERLNAAFAQIFAGDEGSGVTFASAEPAREDTAGSLPPLTLHLNFAPQAGRGAAADTGYEDARGAQLKEIVALIRGHQGSLDGARHARTRGEDRKFRIAVLGRTRNALAPVAQALREAQIPFRAVDLEKLSSRPEVTDALALARALLNSQDRVAWLGVLRAPWCGLSLDDLNAVAGDPDQYSRPVVELLAERLPRLSEAGQVGANRVLQAVAAASEFGAAQPTASLGTWLEQAWLLVGGAACVDSAARANLSLLWSSLDQLPGGAEDLLGAGLAASLDKLTALPDPASSGDCGVQLMTIHKSKGLEFEVVIVPELHAGGGRGRIKLLSWLERGLEREASELGEITEFLIAPLQTKGAEKGGAKAWVDRVYRERESQEARRILYVAATRAREELHLFARPACKFDADGSCVLVEPANSLLATAWPAFEEEVRARFEEWKAANFGRASVEEEQVESIAASGESNLLVMPASVRPALLRRLPPDYATRATTAPLSINQREEGRKLQTVIDSQGRDSSGLYTRHEGGLLSRALGTAVHSLLEELARRRESLDWEAARTWLQCCEPRIAAQARVIGVDQLQAARIAAQALEQALSVSRDPVGEWILSPHMQAASEAGWAGVVGEALRTVRVDRVFQAGAAPQSDGSDCWWIVDYKTAHADNANPDDALPELRAQFAPQIEAYGHILRNLHGNETPIRAGLYYPRMLVLDWWEL
jgi:ATP-dependent exoDNAse (exonuclease V) beta subunit